MSSLFQDDPDDDISLRTRRIASPEYGGERSAAEVHEAAHDREVTLNTGTVLALFFALALVCAVFFGFGYSMGRKSAQPVTAASDSSTPTGSGTDSSASSGASSYKPAPGSPAIQAIPGYLSQTEANAANEKAGAQTVSSPRVAEKPAPVTRAEVAPVPAIKPAPVVRTTPVITPPPAVTAPLPSPVSASATAPDAIGSTYVQIAAVSHQEDADVLLSALKRRGYKVIQRSEPADRLIHVQIGPFGTRKDAEVTRQKLLSDGYNAFLK